MKDNDKNVQKKLDEKVREDSKKVPFKMEMIVVEADMVTLQSKPY